MQDLILYFLEYSWLRVPPNVKFIKHYFWSTLKKQISNLFLLNKTNFSIIRKVSFFGFGFWQKLIDFCPVLARTSDRNQTKRFCWQKSKIWFSRPPGSIAITLKRKTLWKVKKILRQKLAFSRESNVAGSALVDVLKSNPPLAAVVRIVLTMKFTKEQRRVVQVLCNPHPLSKKIRVKRENGRSKWVKLLKYVQN